MGDRGKEADPENGKPGGLRGASGLPKGLGSEDEAVKGRRRDVADVAVGTGREAGQG